MSTQKFVESFAKTYKNQFVQNISKICEETQNLKVDFGNAVGFYNLESIKQKRFKEFESCVADAICFSSEAVYIIEFKSGNLDEATCRKISQQMTESIAVVLPAVMRKNCNDFNFWEDMRIIKKYFFVVYSEEKNDKMLRSNKLYSALKALKLAHHVGLLYDEVIPCDNIDFAKTHLPEIIKNKILPK